MTMLCIHPRFNTEGRRDASGAFSPKAREFLKIHGVEPDLGHNLLMFDNTVSLAARVLQLRKVLRVPQPGLKTLAFFCHGWATGIQAGFTTKTVKELAELVKQSSEGLCERVILYACDSGRDGDKDREDDLVKGPAGEGGFADALRDELSRRAVSATVFAHATEGHCTNNPYVRVFKPDDPDGTGGEWLVAPGSRLWASWRRALRETDLWARFPFMSRLEVEGELSGADLS